jgi:hypothetical protein
MDDFQGRLGTPGALVRNGAKPEAMLLSPLSAPGISAVQVDSDKVGGRMVSKKQGPASLAELRQTIDPKSDGDNSGEDFDKNIYGPVNLKTYRLFDKHLRVGAPDAGRQGERGQVLFGCFT